MLSISSIKKIKSNNYKESFSLNKLLGIFKDLAKSNLFKVTLNPPSVISTNTPDLMEVFVKSATIPSLTLGKIEIKRAGNTLNLPADLKYGDVTLTMWNDDNYETRNFFYKWQALYGNNNENQIGNYETLLKGTITIEQLNNNFDSVFKVICYNAWPSEIGDIQLSHDDTDNRETFTVKFEYSSFEIETK